MTRRRSYARMLAVACGLAATGWLVPALAQQQPLLPRALPQKMTLTQMQAIPSANQVVVKFREGSTVRLRNGQLTGADASQLAAVRTLLGRRLVPMASVRRMHTRPEDDLERERTEGQQRSGRQLADLNLYYIIDLPAGASPAEVANALNALAVVEHAEPAQLPALPPVDISPPTADFSAGQGYKNNPPQGIGVPAPGEIVGSDGSLIRFTDVEYSWRLDHEDLEIAAATHTIVPPGMTPVDPFSDANHGTAVLGEIHGEANTYGITGIAPGALAFVAPANFSNGYNPAAAISAASGASAVGDVIVIEQQAPVCGGACGSNQVGCGPLEAIQSVFDAVSTATANGRIVVAAAGNGSVNLDGPACGTTFNRNVRDSGAIIVGAGSSTDHSRLNFSSYGSRVDVQGWGENVTTSGYGDLFNPGDERQRYTSVFSGTSSATPIVAGAVLSIQGARRSCGFTAATPSAMRQALTSTGTAQGNPGTGNIGPLPRIREALIAVGGATCLPVLQVTPASNIAASGSQGGPFSPSSFQYQLSSTRGSVGFSISGIPTWLTASFTSGTATTSPITVTFTVNGNANSLTPNTYNSTISFTNTTSGQGNTTRSASIVVTPAAPPPLLSYRRRPPLSPPDLRAVHSHQPRSSIS